MSEPDGRRRIDLDLFILALIDGGLSTPYEFQKEARLSQGATVPALQRLLEGRFVRHGKTGPRGRTDYQLTAAGRKLLKNGWQALIEQGPSGDLDADLRVALVTLWARGDPREAVDFLRQAAKKKMGSAIPSQPSVDRENLVSLARWYTDLRSVSQQEVLAAESAALRVIAEALPQNLSIPARQGTPARKKRKAV